MPDINPTLCPGCGRAGVVDDPACSLEWTLDRTIWIPMHCSDECGTTWGIEAGPPVDEQEYDVPDEILAERRAEEAGEVELQRRAGR